jgi:hypothetical protein
MGPRSNQPGGLQASIRGQVIGVSAESNGLRDNLGASAGAVGRIATDRDGPGGIIDKSTEMPTDRASGLAGQDDFTATGIAAQL